MLKKQSAISNQRSAEKCDPRMGTIVRKNGKTFKDRVCGCGKDHWHGSNTCIACQNAIQKKRHGSWYIKKADSVGETIRQKRLVEHTRRIQAEVAGIEAAGLTIDEHVYEDVEKFMAGTLSADITRKEIQL
jgi:hypothetical protein